MKINSICIFIAGALLSLLLVFFIKPSFLVSPIDSEEQYEREQGAENEGLTQGNTQLNSDSENANNGCDQECVLSVIERLKTGQDLRNEYGPSIGDVEALNTAKYLEGKPELIKEIEASLAKIKSQSERNSIVWVFRHLSTEKIVDIAQRLIESDFSKAQIDGLNMLYSESKKGVDIKAQLERFINNAKDFRAVFTAMKYLHKSYPDEFEAISSQRLNAIISDGSDEYNQGKALKMKVRLFTTNDSIKADIIKGLTSKKDVFQFDSIVALGSVLSKQRKLKDSSFDWRQDSNLKAIIDGIANDADADLESRKEVIDLLIRYY